MEKTKNTTKLACPVCGKEVWAAEVKEIVKRRVLVALTDTGDYHLVDAEDEEPL